MSAKHYDSNPLKKPFRLPLLMVFVSLLIVSHPGCTPRSSQVYTASFPALGTLASLTVEASNDIIGRQWEAQIKMELDRIGYELWEGEPNGALGRLNSERWTDNQELIDLILRAFEVGEITGGAFDIRIGEVVSGYGFINPGERATSLDSLDQLVGDAQALRFEHSGSVYLLAGSSATLTLGGIAKGYAVDQCVRILQQAGCRAGIVNIGGDLRVWGRGESNPWLIGIEDPGTNELLATLEMTSGGCATSGNYRNRYIANGDTIHHLIDPYSGKPAKGKTSVTVAAPTCELADALATGMFVMPLDASVALADSLDDVGLLVLSDQRITFADEDITRLIRKTD